MPINPLGEATYKGLAAPLFGDAVVEQENSSNYIRSYVHTSANTGGFLLFMDYRADKASSLLTDLAVADIDVDGGFRVLSGTTVLMELDSSGLYDGTTQILSADGIFPAARVRKNVVTVAAASTRYSVDSSLSGSLFVVSTQVADTQFIELPAATVSRGDTFEFFVNSTAAGTVRFISSGTTGPSFYAMSLTTALNASTAGVQPGSTGRAFLRFTCIDSTAASWIVESQLGFSSETTGATMIAENFAGNLVAATTST